jgi:hypothetical protein
MQRLADLYSINAAALARWKKLAGSRVLLSFITNSSTLLLLPFVSRCMMRWLTGYSTVCRTVLDVQNVRVYICTCNVRS